MQPISVVMIANNEAHIIGETIKSVHQLTDDIVIGDTGSSDSTPELARSLGCKVTNLHWEGFGKTKNKALALAKYDWVLYLDADEAVNEELLNTINQLRLDDNKKVYELKYTSFIGGKQVRYGEWKTFYKTRLFNRKLVKWSDDDIHEYLLLPEGTTKEKLAGSLLHYAIHDLKEYADKMSYYADLMAKKYHQQGKKASAFKLYIYPVVQFFLNYCIKLAVLDGRLGFASSVFTSYYVFLKYHRLKELQSKK